MHASHWLFDKSDRAEIRSMYKPHRQWHGTSAITDQTGVFGTDIEQTLHIEHASVPPVTMFADITLCRELHRSEGIESSNGRTASMVTSLSFINNITK